MPTKRWTKLRFAELRIGGPGVRDALREESMAVAQKTRRTSLKNNRAHMARIKDKELCTAKALSDAPGLAGHLPLGQCRHRAASFQSHCCRWVRWTARFYKVGIFTSMLTLAKMIEQHLEGILELLEMGHNQRVYGRIKQRL